jgi:hypothetical protein
MKPSSGQRAAIACAKNNSGGNQCLRKIKHEKTTKKTAKARQEVSQAQTPVQTYADSTPLDRVTYLEAKLIAA